MSQNRTNNTVTLGEIIREDDVKIGQWIKFSIDENNQNSLSEKQKAIYQKDRIFLVFIRRCLHSRRFHLIDENGETYTYYPMMHSLDHVDLVWNQKIIVFSKNEIETFYDKEKILMIYETTQKRLDKMSDYFSKYKAIRLNVEIEIQQIKNKITVDSYTQGATAGALSEKLPFELSTYVGSFLGRKEGGRLAQTCKLAAQIANEEQDRKIEAIKRKF